MLHTMEDIRPDSHGSALRIVDNDSVFFNDLGNITTLNGGRFHCGINLIDTSCKDEVMKVSDINADLSKNSSDCLILGNGIKLDNENTIRLSLEDLNKLGIQLSLEQEELSNDLNVDIGNLTTGESYFISALPEKDKFCVASPDSTHTNSNESVSPSVSVVNMNTPVDEDSFKTVSFEQLELVSPFGNGNYFLQLPNGNTAKISISPLTPLVAETGTITLNDVSEVTKPTTLSDLLGNKFNSLNTEEPLFTFHENKTSEMNLLSKKIELKPKPIIKQRNGFNGITFNGQNILKNQPKSYSTPAKGQSLLIKNNRRGSPSSVDGGSKNKRICILNKTSSHSPIRVHDKPASPKIHISASEPYMKEITEDNKQGTRMFEIGSSPHFSNHRKLQQDQSCSDNSGVVSSAAKDQQTKNVKQVKRLTPSQLQQVVSVLKKYRNNKGLIKTPSVLYDTETNTRIICRVVYPKDFDMNKINKFNKPSKSLILKEEKEEQKKLEKDVEVLTSVARTRSGRLSRPPKHIINSAKDIMTSEVTKVELKSNVISDENPPAQEKSEKCPTCNKVFSAATLAKHFALMPDHCNEKLLTNTLDIQDSKNISNLPIKNPCEEKKRKVKKKGVNWKKRMKLNSGAAKNPPLNEILEWYTESEVLDAFAKKFGPKLSLWEFLLMKVNRSSMESKVDVIRKELSSLSTSVQQAAQDMLTSAHELNSDMLNDSALTTFLEKSKHCNDCSSAYLQKLQEDLKKPESKSESDVEQLDVKVENIEGEKPKEAPRIEIKKEEEMKLCEESCGAKSLDLELPESVDDLVNARLASMTDDIIVPSLPSKAIGDDVLRGILSDPAPSSGLFPLDKRVSASTEDLMKSLENLSDISQQAIPPPELDFTVLSQDFSTEKKVHIVPSIEPKQSA